MLQHDKRVATPKPIQKTERREERGDLVAKCLLFLPNIPS